MGIYHGFMLSLVAIMETVMTMEVVNKMTNSAGDRIKMIISLGFSNIFGGFFGGDGGIISHQKFFLNLFPFLIFFPERIGTI